MVYTRGSSDEFDRFAKVTGDSGWSWKELQPYIMKSESFGPPADNHNTTGQFNPSVHGFKGPLHVALPGFPLGTDSMVIEATHELPEFPFNIDMNSGDTIGMGTHLAAFEKIPLSSLIAIRVGPSYYWWWSTQQLRYSILSITIHFASQLRCFIEYTSHKNDAPGEQKWVASVHRG